MVDTKSSYGIGACPSKVVEPIRSPVIGPLSNHLYI